MRKTCSFARLIVKPFACSHSSSSSFFSFSAHEKLCPYAHRLAEDDLFTNHPFSNGRKRTVNRERLATSDFHLSLKLTFLQQSTKTMQQRTECKQSLFTNSNQINWQRIDNSEEKCKGKQCSMNERIKASPRQIQSINYKVGISREKELHSATKQTGSDYADTFQLFQFFAQDKRVNFIKQ